jgi:hypothetical protein
VVLLFYKSIFSQHLWKDFKNLFENTIKEMYVSPLVFENIYKALLPYLKLFSTISRAWFSLSTSSDHLSFDDCCISLIVFDFLLCAWFLCSGKLPLDLFMLGIIQGNSIDFKKANLKAKLTKFLTWPYLHLC